MLAFYKNEIFDVILYTNLKQTNLFYFINLWNNRNLNKLFIILCHMWIIYNVKNSINYSLQSFKFKI